MATNNVPSSSSNIYYHTRKIFESCSFTWTVEDINLISYGEDCSFFLESAIFPTDKDSKCMWQMELYPCGSPDFGNKLIQLNLCLLSDLNFRAKVKGFLSLSDINNKKIRQVPILHAFYPRELGQKLNFDFNRAALYYDLSTSDNENYLRINVEMSIAINDCNEFTTCKIPSCAEVSMYKLVDDYFRMFTEQNISDIEIIVQGTKFQAHQAILIARSPVLGAMLQHDLREKQQNLIKIDDIESETFKKLLCFLYSSRIEFIDVFDAMKILEAADKYAVEDLKSWCEEYLICNLNVSNAFSILCQADLHSAFELKSKAIEFISKNKSSLSIDKCKASGIKNNQLLEILKNLITDKEKSEK